MERVICLLLGYAFGIFQTGFIYGKMNHIDIRKYGSGNSGTTNALRVLGKKAALIVFAGDFLKTVLPCLLVRFLFKGQGQEMYLLLLYTGLGVILGHNYPFYLGFKGGKGIAATAGVLVSTDWRVTLICLAAFLLIVIITRYVSLGSLAVVTIFLVCMIIFGYRGDYRLDPALLPEFCIVAAVITGLAFWKHRANIVRLVHGNENKLWGNKKN